MNDWRGCGGVWTPAGDSRLSSCRTVSARILPEIPGWRWWDVDVDRDTIERSIARDLRDRPLTAGESVHVERLGGLRFIVAATDPEGTVRLTDRTDLSVVSSGSVDSDVGSPDREVPTADPAADSGASGSTSETSNSGADARSSSGDGVGTSRSSGNVSRRPCVSLPGTVGNFISGCCPYVRIVIGHLRVRPSPY